ncbi:hypothetical protein O181_131824 [Austropuccinia psidii MF-1]|uniref:Uncharacterized protein n=1 Tax=Austropuccinia psidii MF-1 TaxID=1389203 RepID=A0A9Q3L3Q3_9BASI|nr:hypothetical protein [Austropuccinia psidii MF-1]
MPGEIEHSVKCGCNHNLTLDDIANTLQDIRKRTNMGKYSQNKSSGFREKQPFRVKLKDKPKERVAEVARKKNYCPNCGSTDLMAITVQRQRRKSIPLRKSQRRNPTQKIMNQTLWVMPSGNTLMKNKTQERNL